MAGRTRSTARPAAKAPASAPAASRAQRANTRPPTSPRGRWLRITLLLVLAFILMGLAPAALAARVFDFGPLSHLPLPPNPFPALPRAPAPAAASDLALPHAAWVARETVVRDAPGNGGRPLATLEPGVPITLTIQATTSDALWDAVRWSGPTPATGGRGWVPDAALTQAETNGPAVADVAALSSSVAAALAQLGPTAALAVYYPAAQWLYLANADQPYPLGDGTRALLLAALLAAPSSPAGDALIQPVAQGDGPGLATAYRQIGGSAGLAAFLAHAGITGITPGSNAWSDTQATPRALVQFYAALGSLTPGADLTLAASARARVLGALAPDPTTLALAGLGDPLPSGASVALVTGASQQAATWTICAAGVLTAPSGLTYVAALCVPNQTSSSGATALSPVFTALASLAAS